MRIIILVGAKVQVMVNADEDLDVDVVCGPGCGALIVPEEELLVGAQSVPERAVQLKSYPRHSVIVVRSSVVNHQFSDLQLQLVLLGIPVIAVA